LVFSYLSISWYDGLAKMITNKTINSKHNYTISFNNIVQLLLMSIFSFRTFGH